MRTNGDTLAWLLSIKKKKINPIRPGDLIQCVLFRIFYPSILDHRRLIIVKLPNNIEILSGLPGLPNTADYNRLFRRTDWRAALSQ